MIRFALGRWAVQLDRAGLVVLDRVEHRARRRRARLARRGGVLPQGINLGGDLPPGFRGGAVPPGGSAGLGMLSRLGTAAAEGERGALTALHGAALHARERRGMRR